MFRTLVCALAALTFTAACASLPAGAGDIARSIGMGHPAAPTTAGSPTAGGTGSQGPAGFGWQ